MSFIKNFKTYSDTFDLSLIQWKIKLTGEKIWRLRRANIQKRPYLDKEKKKKKRKRRNLILTRFKNQPIALSENIYLHKALPSGNKDAWFDNFIKLK